MPQLKELLDATKFLNEGKRALITKAYVFAEKAHRGQKRYSGEAYFNHLVETAKILAELGMARRTISAGLLHDVLENTEITPEELESEFGKEVLFLVEGVTKLGRIRYSGKERHIESLRKFFVAMSQDIRVLIIKLADRLHNMRTLEYVPKEKQKRIAQETMKIYVPLAYRLGLRTLKRELEDLAFRHINPEKYHELAAGIRRHRRKHNEQLEKFRKSLLKMLAKHSIRNAKTDTRLKSIYSVYTKIVMRQKDLGKIYDISAVRVHVETLEDCYRVLGIIHGSWRPLPGRIKDYIAFPKPNGYQSLHTTVFTGDGMIIEIQIRTHLMHNQAEYGLASHIAYKERGLGIKDPYYSWFNQFFPAPSDKKKEEEILKQHPHVPLWLRNIINLQSFVTIQTDPLSHLKSDFFQHRMFIFDPKGDVVDLPVGATPLDFAYELDPNIGNRLFGAKVNGKFVHIDTPLKNGDIVEIQTKNSAHPTDKWLKYAKTSFARKEINQYLESVKKVVIRRQKK